MKSYFDHPVHWPTANTSSYAPMDYAERALLAKLTDPNWPSGSYSSSQQPSVSDSYENTDGSDGGKDNFEHLLQAPLASSQYRIDVLRSLLQERDKLSRRLLTKLGSHRCQLEQQLDTTMYGGWHAGLAQQRNALETQLVRIEQAEVKEETEAFRDSLFIHTLLLDANERYQKDTQLAQLLYEPSSSKGRKEEVPP